MRKLGVCILSLLILLSGCSNEKEEINSNNTENINFLYTYGLLKHLKKTNYEIVGNTQHSEELKTIQPAYENFLETGINAYILKSRYYYQYNDDIEFSDEYFYSYPILEENGYSGISAINELYEDEYEKNKAITRRDYITLAGLWDMYYDALENERVSKINSSTFHGYGYSTVSVEYTNPYVNIIFFFTIYQGGMHLLSAYSTEVYDMHNGELIELEDIFSDFGKDKEDLQILLQAEVEGMPIITLKYSDIKQYLSEEFIESLEFEI